MKLIKVTEAAERLGVNRQTLENWGKDGTLKIRTTGKAGKSHWVDADAIDALGDTIKDIEQTRGKLEEEQKRLHAEYQKERQLREDIERELYMINKFGTSLWRREFYKSIPIMLCEIGILNDREAEIMRHIIDGGDIGWVADIFGLTRERVRQIFFKGCRKARHLTTIKAQLDELQGLKEEMANMRTEMKVMNDELKAQRLEEQKLQEMEESERMEYIEKNDAMIRVLNTRIVDCELSVRSQTCLMLAEIKTISDLVKYEKADLLKFRNFGEKSLAELNDFLISKGLTFGMDVDRIYRDHVAQRFGV